MKSEPQVAIMDGDRVRLLPTSAHDNTLREALIQAIEARQHPVGHDLLQSCWRETDMTTYIIIPTHEMKDRMLLVGGSGMCTYATGERFQHVSAMDG